MERTAVPCSVHSYTLHSIPCSIHSKTIHTILYSIHLDLECITTGYGMKVSECVLQVNEMRSFRMYTAGNGILSFRINNALDGMYRARKLMQISDKYANIRLSVDMIYCLEKLTTSRSFH